MVHMISGMDDLKEQLKQAEDKLVVIDFFATWCGPCRAIAPKFEAMTNDYPDVVFLKVDVDSHEEVAEQYNIDVMPTFIFIKSGKNIDSFSGASELKLKHLIEKHK